ncbi:methyltransferase family protein [Oligoflexus tunisiensis]|uniref:methyltransferase family protein n=1 Tax=Oligoflexus tunisiensis TaxID=708132 RepID=UPI00114D270B|nr:isoprenylcysteine carboxylmethyltransferase family protein [Oligoflexus tunisiensis]
MFDKETRVELGEWFFKARDYTPIPLIFLLLIFGHPTVKSATIGLLLIMLGELFRIYSVGFIGTISRTRSQSTGQRLITEGPFSFVRNPLYVANFLITLGFTVFGGSLWLLALTVVLFVVQYYFIVAYEENLLLAKFGEEYEDYRMRVPRWIPDRWPNLDQMMWPDTFTPALKSEKRTLTTIFSLIFLLALFA